MSNEAKIYWLIDAPTLNTSAESGGLFKVLSVEVFSLRCVSTLAATSSPKHISRMLTCLAPVKTGLGWHDDESSVASRR